MEFVPLTALLDYTKKTPTNVKNVIPLAELARSFLKTVLPVLQDSLTREDAFHHAPSASSDSKVSANSATLNAMAVSTTVLLVLTALLASSNADHHAARPVLLTSSFKAQLIAVFPAILTAEPAQLRNSVLPVLILKPYQSMESVITALIHAILAELHHPFA